jgi:hypothetical protein
MGRDMMLREIEAIVNAVAVPVNADIEAGYGDAPTDVAETVTADRSRIGRISRRRGGSYQEGWSPAQPVTRAEGCATGLPR